MTHLPLAPVALALFAATAALPCDQDPVEAPPAELGEHADLLADLARGEAALRALGYEADAARLREISAEVREARPGASALELTVVDLGVYANRRAVLELALDACGRVRDDATAEHLEFLLEVGRDALPAADGSDAALLPFELGYATMLARSCERAFELWNEAGDLTAAIACQRLGNYYDGATSPIDTPHFGARIHRVALVRAARDHQLERSNSAAVRTLDWFLEHGEDALASGEASGALSDPWDDAVALLRETCIQAREAGKADLGDRIGRLANQYWNRRDELESAPSIGAGEPDETARRLRELEAQIEALEAELERAKALLGGR